MFFENVSHGITIAVVVNHSDPKYFVNNVLHNEKNLYESRHVISNNVTF